MAITYKVMKKNKRTKLYCVAEVDPSRGRLTHRIQKCFKTKREATTYAEDMTKLL